MSEIEYARHKLDENCYGGNHACDLCEYENLSATEEPCKTCFYDEEYDYFTPKEVSEDE